MKILPCPFCGSEDVSVYKSWNLAYYFATCETCGSCGSNKETEKEAIEEWNRVYVTVSYGKIFRGAMYAISSELDRIATELGEEGEDK